MPAGYSFLVRIVGSVVLVAAGCLAAASSASAEPIQPVDPTPDKAADFYVDVYPVLEAKCLACHSRAKHEADLVLEDVPGILKGGDSGPAVVPGQPDQSLLFKLCARRDEPAMPPLPNRVGAVALTSAELGRIGRWITEGAKPGKMNPSASAIGWQALPSTMMSSFAMALGPQDRFVAVARANMISICDLTSGREIAKLGDPLIRTVKTPALLPLYDRDVAHFDVVSSLAFSRDGDLLASGGYREIKIWHRQRNSVAARVECGGPLAASALNPSGGLLLVARTDGKLALWDLEQAPEQSAWGPIEGATHAVLLHDGRRAVVARPSGDLSLWDVAEKRELKSWAAGQPVTVLAASPAEATFFSGHADGSIRRWDLPNELPEKPLDPAAEFAAAGSAVKRIALQPDGQQLAAGFADGKLISIGKDLKQPKNGLDAKAGALMLCVAAGGDIAVVVDEAARSAAVRRTGKSPDLTLSAVPEAAIHVRRLEDDRTVAQTRKAQADDATKAAQKESDERATGLEAAQKAQTAAAEAMTKAQTSLEEREAAGKKAKEELAAKPDDEALKKTAAEAEMAATKAKEAANMARDALAAAERNVRFAEAGAQSARSELAKRKSTLDERAAHVADLEKQIAAAQEAVSKSEIRIVSAALSRDARLIATGHSDGLIHLWASDDGRWLETFRGHSGEIDWMTFAGEDLLASADKSGSVIEWNLKPQWKLSAVLGTRPESRLDIGDSPISDRVLALAFSPDGRRLASGGGQPSRSGEVLLWDVGSMTVERALRELHSDTVNTLAFSRDGRLLATGAADKFVRITEIDSGKLLKTLEGHTAHVLGVAWSPDGATLSSAGADGAVKIWNTETGEQRKSVAATTGQVTAVAAVGLTDQIVIANNKGQCQLLERSSGKVLRTYSGGAGYLYQVAVTHDGKELMAAGEDGVLRAWNLAKGDLVRELKP